MSAKLVTYNSQNYAGTLGARGQPITLLFLPIMLCCSALKIHVLFSILCSRTIIVIKLLCFLYAILHEQSLHVADNL